MSVLTETTVLARTRAQDLKSVRKLNCWGSDLNDISIIRRLPNVEILSLSVNSISTLEDFHYCKNLQELYIRKNSVADLNEIRHLQNLSKLQSLWLADNPCAELANYRHTVLRALPNLKKLDNIAVHPGEVEAAKIHGLPILSPGEAVTEVLAVPDTNKHPLSPDGTQKQNHTDVGDQPAKNDKIVGSVSLDKVASHPSGAPSRGSSQESPKEESINVLNSNLENNSGQSVSEYHPSDPENSQPHAFHARVQTMVSHSTHSQKNSSCDNTQSSPSEDHQSLNGSPGCTNDDDSHNILVEISEQTTDSSQHIPGDSRKLPLDTVRVHTSQEIYHYSDSRTTTASCPPSSRGSPARMLSKGGKNRNANILSAVLCLIKELDYANLEVVETAIHCRMEELED